MRRPCPCETPPMKAQRGPRTAALVVFASVPLSLTSCVFDSDLDNSIDRGCNGLRVMSESYLTGDQQTFDDALRQGWSFGFAAELADGDLGPDSVISVGLQAVKIYDVAAYEPAERNNGELVWRGRGINTEDQVTVDRALAACDAR